MTNSSLTRTVSNAELEVFLSDIRQSMEVNPRGYREVDITECDNVILPRKEAKDESTFFSARSDEERVREFCRLMANSIGRIPAKKACTLARLLMEKTGYGILPQRSMYPEKYTNHPESLDAKKTLLLGMTPMVADAEKQRLLDSKACEEYTKCKVEKSRSKCTAYVYVDMETGYAVDSGEYEKRYLTHLDTLKAARKLRSRLSASPTIFSRHNSFKNMKISSSPLDETKKIPQDDLSSGFIKGINKENHGPYVSKGCQSLSPNSSPSSTSSASSSSSLSSSLGNSSSSPSISTTATITSFSPTSYLCPTNSTSIHTLSPASRLKKKPSTLLIQENLDPPNTHSTPLLGTPEKVPKSSPRRSTLSPTTARLTIMEVMAEEIFAANDLNSSKSNAAGASSGSNGEVVMNRRATISSFPASSSSSSSSSSLSKVPVFSACNPFGRGMIRCNSTPSAPFRALLSSMADDTTSNTTSNSASNTTSNTTSCMPSVTKGKCELKSSGYDKKRELMTPNADMSYMGSERSERNVRNGSDDNLTSYCDQNAKCMMKENSESKIGTNGVKEGIEKYGHVDEKNSIEDKNECQDEIENDRCDTTPDIITGLPSMRFVRERNMFKAISEYEIIPNLNETEKEERSVSEKNNINEVDNKKKECVDEKDDSPYKSCTAVSEKVSILKMLFQSQTDDTSQEEENEVENELENKVEVKIEFENENEILSESIVPYIPPCTVQNTLEIAVDKYDKYDDKTTGATQLKSKITPLTLECESNGSYSDSDSDLSQYTATPKRARPNNISFNSSIARESPVISTTFPQSDVVEVSTDYSNVNMPPIDDKCVCLPVREKQGRDAVCQERAPERAMQTAEPFCENISLIPTQIKLLTHTYYERQTSKLREEHSPSRGPSEEHSSDRLGKENSTEMLLEANSERSSYNTVEECSSSLPNIPSKVDRNTNDVSIDKAEAEFENENESECESECGTESESVVSTISLSSTSSPLSSHPLTTPSPTSTPSKPSTSKSSPSASPSPSPLKSILSTHTVPNIQYQQSHFIENSGIRSPSSTCITSPKRMCDLQSDVSSLRGMFCSNSGPKGMLDTRGIAEKNRESGDVCDESAVRREVIMEEEMSQGVVREEQCNVQVSSSRTNAMIDSVVIKEEKKEEEKEVEVEEETIDKTMSMKIICKNDCRNNNDALIRDSPSPISTSPAPAPAPTHSSHSMHLHGNTTISKSVPNNNVDKRTSKTRKIWYETHDINSLELNRTNTNIHVRINRKVRTPEHSVEIETAEDAEEEAAYRLSIRCEIAMWKYQWELASFQAARVARILESESS